MGEKSAARKTGRTWFNWSNIASLFASVATAGLIYTHLDNDQWIADYRVQYLSNEIAKLTSETKEVDGLQDMILTVLDRKQIVENIQRDRLHPPLLLDDLIRRRPKGAYLVSVKFEQSRVEVTGYAASREIVDKFVGNIAVSSFLTPPQDVNTGTAVASATAYPVIRFSFKASVRNEQIEGTR